MQIATFRGGVSAYFRHRQQKRRAKHLAAEDDHAQMITRAVVPTEFDELRPEEERLLSPQFQNTIGGGWKHD